MVIIGHQKQWNNLQRMKEQKRIPHAMLFCGQEQLGKKTVAFEFLKLFFGENFVKHPDFIYLEPEGNEIQIAQIRDLNWKLSLKSFSGEKKAVIIDRAHLMNQEAQNCFLKTLEEPKGEAIIILVSEYPGLILPTIRSRIQKVKFFPVAKSEIENYLKIKNLPESQIGLLSEISMGRPGLAIDFLLNSEKLADFKKKIKELTTVLDSDLAGRFQYAKEVSEEDNLGQVLGIWLSYFRNVMLAKLSLQKKWVVLRKDYTFLQLKNILKSIQTTIFLSSTTNINKKLALELLLTDL
jgi:DNA polymerase III subunit delta'